MFAMFSLKKHLSYKLTCLCFMIAAKLAEPVSSIPRFAAFVAKKKQEAGKKPVTPGKRFLLSM